MPLALITTSPLEVVATYPQGPVTLDLPGVGVVTNVDAGWQAPDDSYRLVAYAAFVPPPGKVIVGGATYTVDNQGAVTEVYGVTDAPNPATLPMLTFRNLFTADERLALATASLTDPQVRLWIDDCLFSGFVNVAAADVAARFAYLVAHNIITQERADAIMAYRLF